MPFAAIGFGPFSPGEDADWEDCRSKPFQPGKSSVSCAYFDCSCDMCGGGVICAGPGGAFARPAGSFDARGISQARFACTLRRHWMYSSEAILSGLPSLLSCMSCCGLMAPPCPSVCSLLTSCSSSTLISKSSATRSSSLLWLPGESGERGEGAAVLMAPC